MLHILTRSCEGLVVDVYHRIYCQRKKLNTYGEQRQVADLPVPIIRTRSSIAVNSMGYIAEAPTPLWKRFSESVSSKESMILHAYCMQTYISSPTT